MIAPRARPGLSLRLSVTDRCQLRCRYCMPPEGVAKRPHADILSFEEIVRFVRYLQTHHALAKVRITGGDPLARTGIEELVGMLSARGIPDLAMTTNGQRLGELAARLRAAGLHRVNVSLDSVSPAVFRDLTRGGELDQTLAGIDAALRERLCPVKLNMVVLRGLNDREVGDVLSFALAHGCEARFLELMPVGHGGTGFEDAFVSSDEVREQLQPGFLLAPLPREPGASARRFRVTRSSDGATGAAGFVSPCSDPFCDGCDRLRLTADGRLMGCLAREGGVDIRPALQAGRDDELDAAVQQVMGRKRDGDDFAQAAPMVTIGG